MERRVGIRVYDRFMTVSLQSQNLGRRRLDADYEGLVGPSLRHRMQAGERTTRNPWFIFEAIQRQFSFAMIMDAIQAGFCHLLFGHPMVGTGHVGLATISADHFAIAAADRGGAEPHLDGIEALDGLGEQDSRTRGVAAEGGQPAPESYGHRRGTACPRIPASARCARR